MIDISSIKAQLSGLTTRANLKAVAEAWGTGDIGIPHSLIPEVTPEAEKALRRLAMQAQTIGPRIVKTKRFGIMGDLNWGGDNALLDQLLRQQDLEGTANEMLEHAFYSGIIAGVTRRDPLTEEVRVEPLVGHVEPIYSKDSPTLATGIIHAWTDGGLNGTAKWTVRIYDLTERTMREWADLSEPTRIDKSDPTDAIEPSAEYPGGAPMPRFAILERGNDRMPKGELAKLLPLLFADWSSQVRGARIEEATAIPQLVVKGEVEDGTNERSPTHVIRVIEDGDAKYIIPGDLTSLHTQHDRVLERIREDANLPGGFMGTQTPSGVALQEANAKFISANRFAAARLSRVLTELVADLCEAEGIPDPPLVTITINREFTKAQDIEDAALLYEKGLLEHGAAVRHISPFVPTWEDGQVEEFIDSRRVVSVPE